MDCYWWHLPSLSRGLGCLFRIMMGTRKPREVNLFRGTANNVQCGILPLIPIQTARWEWRLLMQRRLSSKIIPHTTASPYCFGHDSKCILLTLGYVVFSGLRVQVSCSTVLPPQQPILINTHDSSREVNLQVILSDILFFDITLWKREELVSIPSPCHSRARKFKSQVKIGRLRVMVGMQTTKKDRRSKIIIIII